jgi:hypothetical protein
VTRYIDLRRDNESADVYAFRVETTGPVRAWKGNGDSRLTFRLIGPPPGLAPMAQSGSSTLIAYDCAIDCRRVPIMESFTIAVRMQYNNAFSRRETWWVGALAQDKTKRISMRVVFPPNLPFKNPSFRRYPNGSRLESVPFDGKAYNIAGQPELLWTVSPPISGSIYRVNWDWSPGENRR